MIEKMPKIALGTWMVTKPNEIKESITAAFKAGYTHIDTAQIYFNEELIGDVIEELGIQRKKYWITSKVWVLNYKYHAYDSVRVSLRRLKVDYIDTMLLHADAGEKRNVIAYKDLMRARDEGLIRTIGVSNFSIDALKAIKKATGEYPKYNQIICSPKQRIVKLEEFCKANDITLMAYSTIRPYFNPNVFYPNSSFNDDEKAVVDVIAKELGTHPAIVLLRWAMQHDYVILPKSAKEERVIANFDADKIQLSDEQMKKLDALSAFSDEEFKKLMAQWTKGNISRDEDEKMGVRISAESDQYFIKMNQK